MPRTLLEMRRAGAVSAIALKYHSLRGTRDAWGQVAAWAAREFRDCPAATVRALVKRAKESVDLASRMERSKPTREFSHKDERNKQA